MTKDTTTNVGATETRDHHFLTGFVMGAAAGAGLALLFAPRVAAELRQRVTDSAGELGRTAAKRYEQTSARVGGAVDQLTKKGQDVRDEVLGAVATGAQKVERFAVDHATAKPHSR